MNNVHGLRGISRYILKQYCSLVAQPTFFQPVLANTLMIASHLAIDGDLTRDIGTGLTSDLSQLVGLGARDVRLTYTRVIAHDRSNRDTRYMGINLKPTQALSNFSPKLKKAWLVEKSDWGGVAVHVIAIPSREKKRKPWGFLFLGDIGCVWLFNSVAGPAVGLG